MITRKEYMASSESLYHAYYLEVALESLPLDIPCTVERVKEALLSGDEHLNKILLAHWDAYVSQYGGNSRMSKALKARGDWLSLGTGVCVLKTYAKHLAKT